MTQPDGSPDGSPDGTGHHQAPGYFPGTQACPQVLGDAAPDSPWDLAAAWLPDNEDVERPVVTLATLDADGFPNGRSVLLSAYDQNGFRIHTDGRSSKAAELSATPRAALVIRWPDLARQLVVQGEVERDDDASTARAFSRRDVYLRVLAHQSTAEYAQLTATERETRWAAAEQHARVHGVHQPPTWVGFVIRPRRLAFWAGSTTMASRRVEYRRTPDGWQRRYLPG